MFSIVAVCLIALPGPVVDPFAPVPPFGGHWGIDIAVPPGAVVGAPLAGTVSFAGSVAGMRTVTIRRGGVRVSLSYLSAVLVVAGDVVRPGDPVGLAGRAHGRGGVHIGLRRWGRYVDPAVGCRSRGVVRLLPPVRAGNGVLLAS